VKLDVSYRADLIVEGKVLLELKAVDRLQPIHTMQAVTYLQLAKLPVGLLINFNVPALMTGVKRVVRSPWPGKPVSRSAVPRPIPETLP
jgi:GxxExxY protein